MLNVAIVDDHETFRMKLRTLLQTHEGICIAAEACSGEQFLDMARTIGVDAVCMDISMPGMSGIEATRRLLAVKPAVRVIGLSAYDDPLYVEAMLQAGAAGYFTKADADDTLLQALCTATADRPCFGAGISAPAAAVQGAPARRYDGRAAAAEVRFQAKELEVLALIGKGWTPSQIGLSLAMAPAVVDAYHRNIARKLKLRDPSQLVEYAVRQRHGAR